MGIARFSARQFALAYVNNLMRWKRRITKEKIMANIENAQKLCNILHEELGFLYFPALTGGVLYKEGERKDIDIVIYRHRQNTSPFELEDIEGKLASAGLTEFKHFGFVTKAKWNGINIDLFNPETNSFDSDYQGGQ